ncbi:hypothetical protein [Allonocardiopsis opalescens]|uniref:Minor tail protein n=1 Tax=Allonocardiopsis opalescens TaxID=1144618 RepID=A0A2T0PVK5_9ACTN|nr:hypothetical protein [Allonocardiopsis opalescens]PRX95564.1 hypothetical protein CLV72_109173 [Allonocardiopsis opalescens]
MTWRYHALRLPDRTWISRGLPLRDVRLSPAVSGPYRLTATLDPDRADLLDADGEPLIQEHSTLILAEADGVVRGGGIVTAAPATGPTMEITATGFTGHAAGQPLMSTHTWGGSVAGTTGNGVDPLTVVRALWDHLQAQPNGDLGVTYEATTTPFRLGSWFNARRLPTEAEPNPPANEVEPEIPINKVWTNSDTKPAAASGKIVYWRYELAHWDNVDIGGTVDELARTVPFDYREHYAWDGSGPDGKGGVALRLDFGYPRLGAYRPALRFVEGENVTEVVTVDRDGADYANVVVARGAGEGSKQLVQTASVPDGRLRRAVTIERSDITSASALRAAATQELMRRSTLTDITGFTVDASHPHAPIGSFAPGDDVLVRTRTGWRRATAIRVRITGFDYEPGSARITVTCSRSDGFDYSGGGT